MEHEKMRLDIELKSLKDNAERNDHIRRNMSAINVGAQRVSVDRSYDESLMKKLETIENSLKKDKHPSYPPQGQMYGNPYGMQ
jgi:hypothetical protein